MEKFHVGSPHTQEECLRALDELLAKGSDVLASYEWGCMAGDHTGYATVGPGDGQCLLHSPRPSGHSSFFQLMSKNRYSKRVLDS